MATTNIIGCYNYLNTNICRLTFHVRCQVYCYRVIFLIFIIFPIFHFPAFFVLIEHYYDSILSLSLSLLLTSYTSLVGWLTLLVCVFVDESGFTHPRHPLQLRSSKSFQVKKGEFSEAPEEGTITTYCGEIQYFICKTRTLREYSSISPCASYQVIDLAPNSSFVTCSVIR